MSEISVNSVTPNFNSCTVACLVCVGTCVGTGPLAPVGSLAGAIIASESLDWANHNV